jgi:hypothetical protein
MLNFLIWTVIKTVSHSEHTNVNDGNLECSAEAFQPSGLEGVQVLLPPPSLIKQRSREQSPSCYSLNSALGKTMEIKVNRQ